MILKLSIMIHILTLKELFQFNFGMIIENVYIYETITNQILLPIEAFLPNYILLMFNLNGSLCVRKIFLINNLLVTFYNIVC